MLLNQSKYLEELDGEGNDLPGGEASEDETPSYLFGDVTADEATERWNYVRELPNHLRGLESRVGEAVNPVMEQLRAVQERLGTQPAFEPKLDAVQKVLQDYDPKLAEALVPALTEALTGSFSTTPLGPEALEPHVSPMLGKMRESMVEEMLPVLFDSLPFDANAIVERDPQGNVAPPKTELQKEFATWWEQADAPTRNALGTLGLPYVQALQKFGKWRADRIRIKGDAAGAASARLSGAAQSRVAGQRQESSGSELRTEEDGYRDYFKKHQRS